MSSNEKPQTLLGYDQQADGRTLLGERETTTAKVEKTNDVSMHTVRAAVTRLTDALKEAGQMLRIILFLHSANDLYSVLRLYGMAAMRSTNEA